jgi:EpsI family protein
VKTTWRSKYIRALTITLVLQGTLFYTASHGDSRPLNKPLKDFPETLPGWQMAGRSVIDKETIDLLKADDLVGRFYLKTPLPDLRHLSPDQRDALMASTEELFVAYFSSQQQGQSPHSPKHCLPGAGWEPMDDAEIPITIPGLSAPIVVNKYVIAKAGEQRLVLYWLQSHGRVVANEFAAKFYLVADSLRYHRSDTALIRVMVPVVHDDLPTAMAGATNFVQAVFPAVYNYLPR